ncbi:FG-GAP repeat domain-containing protein [Oceanicoccus sagamiensis]|uniref:VCBS repeat-containing protein n=1 Tax=Oceanicoccus sagamiensis TaxID=716816 RepID=A0A1X9NDJ3_9GAMM|nr:VCBS repeat-containing protein [Oceanicoccus sagamiensis]ARN73619.1 hypothetical protein BST96_05485 [Oceanicoccus sagamiensis]
MKLISKVAALSLAIASSYGAAEVPEYSKLTIDADIAGAAFVVDGNLAIGKRPELVVSAFGDVAITPYGPVFPDGGTVTLYQKLGFGRGAALDEKWHKVTIVSEDENITVPNRPTLANVKDCHIEQRFCRNRTDVIVPGGSFFDTFGGQARGSITWWENHWNGNVWLRNDVVTNSPFSYHSVAFDDFNGDGHKDIISVGEDAGNPSAPEDDIIELHLFAGNGDGTFEPAQTVGIGGGGLIEAYDVDGDGDADVVSPQYFGPVSGQPFVPGFARTADVASYVWFENLGDGTFAKHAIGVNEGPGFAIFPVENFRGDGVTRWIATNHTNANIPFPPFALYPEPAVYEFTPGDNPRLPWAVRTLSNPGDFPVEGSVGQSAPGTAKVGYLNDDERLDIAVSGDGSRAVYWMEQQEDGSFITHQLPGSDGNGQAGGPVIADFNRDGKDEIIFGSFDLNSLSIWTR